MSPYNGHAKRQVYSSQTIHTRWGLWDLYEQVPENRWSSMPGIRGYLRAVEACRSAKYIRALLKLVLQQPMSAGAYVLTVLVADIALPALSLWFSSLIFGQIAGGSSMHALNRHWLFFIVVSKVVSSTLTIVLRGYTWRIAKLVQQPVKAFFIRHTLKAHVGLDVPTSANGPNLQKLEITRDDASAEQAWDALESLIRTALVFISLLTSFGTLGFIMRQDKNIIPLVVAGAASPLIECLESMTTGTLNDAVWAATCTDRRYLKLRGLYKAATTTDHKKELVVGNMQTHIVQACDDLLDELGQDAVQPFSRHKYFHERWSEAHFSFKKIKYAVLDELPDIVLVLQILWNSDSAPLLVASYAMVQQVVQRMRIDLWSIVSAGTDISTCLNNVKSLYEVVNIPNQVIDGKEVFPENLQETATFGIKIEFRNVSFKYPGTSAYAVRELSFTIERGDLVVIVGCNGSGKSTILKLLTRVYDPSEGQIFFDNRDIKTLRLFDVRQTVACLFQDFTLLPLSLGDNIGLGWPDKAGDQDAVRAASKLAGIDFEKSLPDGLDSYLERPVKDIYVNLPEGTTTVYGQKVDYSSIQAAISPTQDIKLSGGQSQKIAIARTIMRATNGNDHIGLLLFDEPSASMDPIAEHSLFDTLRQLRGSKTMIFSSHRYGNLTRNADIVFYMEAGRILEQGMHDELLAMNGGYAEMWRLQTAAFVS